MTRFCLHTRDRPGLLFAMLRIFATDHCWIAFEGNLASTELFRLEGASYEETAGLKRATILPRLDFVVLPLSPEHTSKIEQAVRSKVAFGGYRGIIHVQIAIDNEIVFGAYDNFGRDSVVVKETISTVLLDDLVSARVLRGYSSISTR